MPGLRHGNLAAQLEQALGLRRPQPARFFGWPARLDDRVRCLFLWFALLNCIFVAPQVLAANPTTAVLLAAILADVALSALLIVAFRTRALPWFGDLVIPLSAVVLTIATGDPTRVQAVFYSLVFFQALYPPVWRVLLRSASLIAVLLVSTSVLLGPLSQQGILPEAVGMVFATLLSCTLGLLMVRAREAEDSLREQADLVHHLREAVLTTDQKLTVTSWNPAAEQLFGASLARQPLPELLGEPFREGPVPLYVLRRGDQHVYVETDLRERRDASGNLRGFISVNRDVSDRFVAEAAHRLADDATLQAKIAAAANQAKNDFLSRVSHELRTPLNAMLGFAQVLELDEIDEDRIECVDQILIGGHKLLSMINDLLDLSAIEAAGEELPLEPVDVGAIFVGCEALARPLAAERGIRVDLEGTATVVANARGLEQITWNLLTNAIKYNQEGGTVRLVCSAQEGSAQIEVSDSGRGIDPDHLHRLFTPFDRLGAENSGIEGTGLGLALCQEIARAMDTVICVETSPQGSTFTLELPRALLGEASDDRESSPSR